MVSHSNGTDIALKAVKALAARGIPTKTLIVIGSVLKPDIAKNGVMDLLESGDLERAVCYCSASDTVLRFGRWSAGYSDLGRRGWLLQGEDVNGIPLFAPSCRSRMECFSRRFQDYGHGTYFADAHRDATFAMIREDMGL